MRGDPALSVGGTVGVSEEFPVRGGIAARCGLNLPCVAAAWRFGRRVEALPLSTTPERERLFSPPPSTETNRGSRRGDDRRSWMREGMAWSNRW